MVRLTPRAGRNEIVGVVRGADGRSALQIRLMAPPVDGAANKALITLLAERLGVRKADILIRAGETARLKTLHVSGGHDAIVAKLLELYGALRTTSGG